MSDLASWVADIVDNSDALDTIIQSESRIKRAYKELLQGYEQDPSKILNEVEKVENYNGLVTQENIQFTSICGHHFLPFFGTINIIYQPNKIITGLGKLPRLVQAYSRRFQIQELLTKQIAEQIKESIDPLSVSVESKATHLCVHSRGPGDRNVETVCKYTI